MSDRLADAYVHEDGASWAGGFFVFRDVKMTEANEEGLYWDLTLLTHPDHMDQDIFETLKAVNDT